jgi:hypothetical protein
MAFYAKDEPEHPAAIRATAGMLSRDQEPRPGNATPPILTVGIGHRFYNPALGRWMTKDPAGETGGEALYAFVLNRPVLFVDRLGLETIGASMVGNPGIDCANSYLWASLSVGGKDLRPNTDYFLKARITHKAQRMQQCGPDGTKRTESTEPLGGATEVWTVYRMRTDAGGQIAVPAQGGVYVNVISQNPQYHASKAYILNCHCGEIVVDVSLRLYRRSIGAWAGAQVVPWPDVPDDAEAVEHDPRLDELGALGNAAAEASQYFVQDPGGAIGNEGAVGKDLTYSFHLDFDCCKGTTRKNPLEWWSEPDLPVGANRVGHGKWKEGAKKGGAR